MKSEDNDQKRRASPDIGLGGVSLEEFMDQFNEDMEPDHTTETSLSSASQIEMITERGSQRQHVWQPDDEVRQQLVIGRDGNIVFRSLKYFKGKGHYSIGRYETTQMTSGTAKEIYQLLDTWLFVSRPQRWNPDSEAGSWLLRVRHEEGPTGIERGSLTGAFVDGIDVSSFIRQRVPVAGLFLFDP